MNRKHTGILIIAFLALLSVVCRIPPTPSSAPTLEPTATSLPVSTATPEMKITDTPPPVGSLDTGMGGDLSIQGIVRDDLGKPVTNVYVVLQVYGASGGWDIGQFARSVLYTDETGFYSFEKVIRLKSGHYEVWLNGEHEYGKKYENSGHYIEAENIKGNTYVLDVTVHAVTDSVFSGTIQYEDVDGSIRNFYSPPFTQTEPGHQIELVRGIPDNKEYAIGGEYARITGKTVEWSGLAGGTYYLVFTFRLSDGVLVQCSIPAFKILPGETKHLDYTIRDCPPSMQPVLQ